MLTLNCTYKTEFLSSIFLSNFSVSNTTIFILIILVLLLMTGIMAGAETAIFSLTAKDINYLKTKNHSTSRLLLELIEQPKILLTSILVANNFMNIAIIITSNVLLNEVFKVDVGVMLALCIQISIVAFILLLFGEVIPKVYAAQNNMKMALFAAPVIKIMMNIFGPISRMLVSSTSFVEGKMKHNEQNNNSKIDFEQALEQSVGHAATHQEINIFKGIIKFGNIIVRQVMTTRLDVCGVPDDINFQELQKIMNDIGFSRMPVFHKSLDKIIGVIHSKDLLPYAEHNKLDWHFLIRKSYFVPEGKLIEDLLKEFQQQRIHFAVVVDEFGGTSGIVTMEDIVEEIIGDIRDEFDDEYISYEKIGDNEFVFEGKTLINDACKIMNLPTETFDTVKGESDSIAGLVLEISGKFPSINEIITFKQFQFKVFALEKLRLQKVNIKIEY